MTQPSRTLAETSHGHVQLTGELAGFSADRPLVLVIRGALASSDQLSKLGSFVPECDLAHVDLPGMAGSPHFRKPSIQTFATAIDEVAATLPNRHKVIVGVSAGALVGFLMRQGDAILALDPIFTTTASKALVEGYQQQWPNHDEPTRSWLAAVLGICEATAEERDYRWVIDGYDRPGAVFIAGRYPDEPADAGLPGVMTKADRAMVTRHPHLRGFVIEGCGHNLPWEAPQLIIDFTRKLVRLPDVIAARS